MDKVAGRLKRLKKWIESNPKFAPSPICCCGYVSTGDVDEGKFLRLCPREMLLELIDMLAEVLGVEVEEDEDQGD